MFPYLDDVDTSALPRSMVDGRAGDNHHEFKGRF